MFDAKNFRLPSKGRSAKSTLSYMVPRIERTIDRAIHKANNRKAEVRVDVQRSWMRHEIVATLTKYAENGWDAKLVFDDTSGDYILLSPAATAPTPA